MAPNPVRLSAAEWEAEGMEALVDLVYAREVVTWGEAEARITTGWRDFRKVQPIQLSGALRRLASEDPPRIVIEETQHKNPVRTLRIPTNGNKTRIEDLRGRKRKIYRRYIGWTQDERLCGRHAETVVHDSLRTASSSAGLWLPPQTPGAVTDVAGKPIPNGLTVDLWAWLADDIDAQPPHFTTPALVEVKNKRNWLYADAPELWELLVKAALFVTQHGIPVLPILACSFSGPTAWWMAYDVGYFTAQTHVQVFSPDIPVDEFNEVVEDTGLVIAQHTGPVRDLVLWLGKELRKEPPNQPGSGLEWWQVQVERFAVLAPHVLEFEVLAHSMPPDTRREAFNAWKARVRDVATWDLRRGW